MEREDEHKTLRMVSWIAFLLSLAALTLAWTAYNRAGKDLEDQVSAQVTKQLEDSRRAAVRAQARAELVALQAKVQAGQSYDKSAEELAAIQQDIEKGYAGAEGEAKEEGEQLNASLSSVGTKLKDSSADSLTVIADLIEKLAANVRD